jgi:hypothetical protein
MSIRGLQGGISVTRAEPSVSTGKANLYCFDLAFTPHTAVASPFVNNNAVVATAARENVPVCCPAPYTDAAAKTYAADTAGDTDEVGFAIVFR